MSKEIFRIVLGDPQLDDGSDNQRIIVDTNQSGLLTKTKYYIQNLKETKEISKSEAMKVFNAYECVLLDDKISLQKRLDKKKSLLQKQATSQARPSNRPGYKYFKEETGNENEIYYDPKIFEICTTEYDKVRYLHVKEHYKGRVTLPANCSSIYRLFEWHNLGNLDLAGVDLENVIDGDSAFRYCVFPNWFIFPLNFNTQSLRSMSGMFWMAEFGEHVHFGQSLNSDCCNDYSWMFYNSRFRRGFVLSQDFYINDGSKTGNIFYDCIFPDFSWLADTEDPRLIVEQLKSLEGRVVLDTFKTVGDAISLLPTQNYIRQSKEEK